MKKTKFSVIAYDSNGCLMDTSSYDPQSLQDAAEVAQRLRKQKGYIVLIRDEVDKKEYFLDENGNPLTMP